MGWNYSSKNLFLAKFPVDEFRNKWAAFEFYDDSRFQKVRWFLVCFTSKNSEETSEKQPEAKLSDQKFNLGIGTQEISFAFFFTHHDSLIMLKI